MVSQAVKYASIFVPIAIVWISLVLDLLPGYKISTSSLNGIILWAPVIAVFIFGIYCLITLYSQVVQFKDRPDEAAALRKEIEEAKTDLRRKGVKLD